MGLFSLQHPGATTRYERRFTISPKLADNKQTYSEGFKKRIYVGWFEAKNCYCYTRTRARSSHKRNFIKKKKKGTVANKFAAVEIDEFLTWDSHITSVSKKVSSVLGDL